MKHCDSVVCTRKGFDALVILAACRCLLGAVGLAIFASAMGSCAPKPTTLQWSENTMQQAADKTYGGDVEEYFGLGWPAEFHTEGK